MTYESNLIKIILFIINYNIVIIQVYQSSAKTILVMKNRSTLMSVNRKKYLFLFIERIHYQLWPLKYSYLKNTFYMISSTIYFLYTVYFELHYRY